MPLSAVDATPALLVVDLQKSIVGIGVPGTPQVVANSARLLEAFRAAGHPVVLINVDAAPGGRSDTNPAGVPTRMSGEQLDFVPELGRVETDLVITKHTRGAFHGTSLEDDLRERGVTQVFVTGIATGSGVEETAREAYARGFHVVSVIDAVADRDPEAHDFVVTRVLPKFTETTTTADVLAAI